ncbi:UDP-glucuronic acid decarboxylase 1 [Pseudocercospora fuligena]|uniref:UDP-glucuronic acid decarboxylase 1 n=1 Tax=Pseudocercospora fuligena TaxID=685502 RepID=A0A8H6RTF1_9PEZI|nr:UDP-glucuronic acid decarboxylase 1 [Pseudocercospora fuligena]
MTASNGVDARHRILVTGGAGFLGSRLVAVLLGQGHSVIVLDNHWTSLQSSLKDLADDPGLTIVQADVTGGIPIEIEPCDQIYHLACPASPVHFATDPLKILDTCYLGTRNVLEKARLWNARVLLASTSEM